MRERLAQVARRQLSTLPGMDPTLLCIRGRETEWPPLWPFRRSSGAQGTGNPEFLYPRKTETQHRPEKTSETEAEVDSEAGKTSVPKRTAG